MTFASDLTRMLFHQLPTERQVRYAEWEADLAQRAEMLQIDSVMVCGNVSEVVLRIRAEFKGDADPSPDRPSTDRT